MTWPELPHGGEERRGPRDRTAPDPAFEYARALLCEVGAEGRIETVPASVGGLDSWAASGAMALTGRRDGPALRPRGAPATAVDGGLLALRAVATGWGLPTHGLDGVGAGLLAERAAIAGFERQGPWSAGGAFVVLEAADGWIGVSCPRSSDLELIPALTLGAVVVLEDDPWRPGSRLVEELSTWTAARSCGGLVGRAHDLGLPLVEVADPVSVDDQQLMARWRAGRSSWVVVHEGGARRRCREVPVVVSLASLWAGPLAAHLLGQLGIRVITVESISRPDGARRGSRDFHDLLHAGQDMVALPLDTVAGRASLARLVVAADLVIDGSRPRAMRHLGIDVDAVVAGGTSWVSITGYGRTGPWADVPAFGDDAAAAGGLLAWDAGGPLPAGDAIADPLTGIHAAVAALAALTRDEASLIDIAMREVALVAARLPSPPVRDVTVAAPRGRRPSGSSRPLGADTDRVLAELVHPS